jgi:carbon monoxide dehydrogenase subunit G
MDITDSFRVATPIDTTWKILLDIERIAPCMPGAQLQEIEGDEFRGIVKVKVGPITAQYKGSAKLASVDEATRTIVIDASGRDTRGNGNASAKITVTMLEDSGGTVVEIETQLNVTGKVAQFGRGVMADVSAKLLKQFVGNLERDVLSAQGDVATPASEEAPKKSSKAAAKTGADAATKKSAGGAKKTAATKAAPKVSAKATSADRETAEASTAPAPEVPQVRKIDMPEPEAVDLLDAAGASVLKRLIPPLVVLAVLLLLWRARARHRS